MPTAIVTDVRFRMSLAILRDLADAGVKVIAVEHENLTPALGFFSNKVSESYFFAKESYLDDLFSLCKKEYEKTGKKPVLMPTSIATLNLLVEENTKTRFLEVASFSLAKKEDLELLNNKEKALLFAKECGACVPEYDGSFPCMVKPLFGEKFGLKAKDRYRKVNTEEELILAKKHFVSICNGEEPLVQKYIDGDGYGFSVFAKDGIVKSSIAHKRIREYPVTGGPSTCCESVDIPELKNIVEKIVSKLSFTGLAMFEFKKGRDGKYYMLEVNPRVWGSYPLTRACGSSMTLDWYLSSCDEEYVLPMKEFKHKRMHYLLSDFAAGFGYIKKGKILLGIGALVDALNPCVKGGLLEFSDMRPALKYLTGKVER